MIDRHHAAFHARRHGIRGLGGTGEGVGSQAIGQAVCFFHHLIQILEAGDHRHGAEGFFIHGPRILGHIGHHRGLIEIALIADALAAGMQLAALGLRILHHHLNPRHAAVMRQWPHGGIRRHAIAHLQGFGVGHEFFDEAIIKFFLHQEARGADANLPGIAELGESQRLGCEIKISIVEDNRRRMAAQFHRHALHMLAGQGGKLLTDGGGAREGDFADDRMRDQIR